MTTEYAPSALTCLQVCVHMRMCVGKHLGYMYGCVSVGVCTHAFIPKIVQPLHVLRTVESFDGCTGRIDTYNNHHISSSGP